jgi:Icc-related predicted phosphoesterase
LNGFRKMKIVAISDVHGKWNKIQVPECDLLISAGDYSFRGERHMIRDFHAWLHKQPATYVISVQGNHELWVQHNFGEATEIAKEACPRVHFIEEGLVDIEGVNVWCSAWTPWFHDWAYNAHRGHEIKRHWDHIPGHTNILVTHGPPYGVLDIVPFADGTARERVGCHDLLEAVKRIKPDLHVFGHIHHSYGEMHVDGTSFYNASICDEMYMASNSPHIIDYIK